MLPTEIDADQALSWGILNWVVPPEEFEVEVQRTAMQLANGPTAAIGRTKFLINRTYYRSLADHLETERQAQIANAPTIDFEEGIRAFMEKRTPDFAGR
jgi:2-(1,2-epoxy-1,2-dihydrophenyl)acetyl-CoA isomerase